MVVPVMERGRAAKRARRSSRVSADQHDFFTFPDTTAAAEQRAIPFRQGVQSFLSNHGRVTYPPSTVFSSFMAWQILLRVGDLKDGPDLSPVVVCLDVVEEDVTRTSRSVYCDRCRVVGWSEHPVCTKRYHFIIRSCDTTTLSGKWCSSGVAADDVEDWVYAQFEDHTHLLHALIHSNGYGHLLNVNGREGGSNFISGRDIMRFWDRLCTRLAVRMVSVMDVSRKYGVDYRLLHAISRGHSWYGEWGYEFRSGSYALTREAYQNAVQTLSCMPLTPLLFQGRNSRTRFHNIIAFYQSLSHSEFSTVKDLFSCLLKMIHEVRRYSPSKAFEKFRSTPSNLLCAWTMTDVKTVQQSMIKVLKATVGRADWVTRKALKGAIWRAASPQLLDYCLEHLGGVLVDDGMVVLSRFNPNSSDFEFRLEPLSSAHHGSNIDAYYPSEEHMKRDLRCLYDSILHPQSMVKYRPEATREKMMDAAKKVLDCKHFIKDYKPSTNHPFSINLWCHLELSDQSKESPAPPPAELLVLPRNGTVADLKSEAAKAFQEVYVIFKTFEVEELPEFGPVDDSITLKLLVGTSGSVRIRGRCSSKHGLLRYRMERGTESWKVDCMCGTKGDDGERMLACDACGVWQHTRCAGIENFDALPSKFHCHRCIHPCSKKTKNPYTNEAAKEMTKAGLGCRRETVSLCDHGGGSRLSVTLSVG